MLQIRLGLLPPELFADDLGQQVEILNCDGTSRDENVRPLQSTLSEPSFELHD